MKKDFIQLNINYLVTKEKLSKNAFGKLFGLNRGAISSYIEGKAKPKLETLQKISAHFKLTLDQIVNVNLEEKAITLTSSSDLNLQDEFTLTEKELNIVRDAVLLHEEELLKDKVFKKWLDLQLLTRENEVLREVKLKLGPKK
jgi:transcriptional regulator with XRE-family HTH domain